MPYTEPQEWLFLVESGRPGRESLAIYGATGYTMDEAAQNLVNWFKTSAVMSADNTRKILAGGIGRHAKPNGGGSSLRPMVEEEVPVKFEKRYTSRTSNLYFRRSDLSS